MTCLSVFLLLLFPFILTGLFPCPGFSVHFYIFLYYINYVKPSQVHLTEKQGIHKYFLFFFINNLKNIFKFALVELGGAWRLCWGISGNGNMALELWALARVNLDWVKKYQMLMTKKESTMAMDHHLSGGGAKGLLGHTGWYLSNLLFIAPYPLRPSGTAPPRPAPPRAPPLFSYDHAPPLGPARCARRAASVSACRPGLPTVARSAPSLRARARLPRPAGLSPFGAVGPRACGGGAQRRR